MTIREEKPVGLPAGELLALLAGARPAGGFSVPDAESWLRLTLVALGKRLTPLDRRFLETAMREYGRLCVAENHRV